MRFAEPRTYFLSMGAYWLVFGLITIFYVRIMNLFQSAEGVAANTPFSDHVWFHGGLDILALCVLLFALSTQPPSRTMLWAGALAALGPTIAIVWSLVATGWWNPLFAAAGIGCFAFSVWGFLLSNRIGKSAERALVWRREYRIEPRSYLLSFTRVRRYW